MLHRLKTLTSTIGAGAMLVLAAGEPALAQTKRLDGHGPVKFGMSPKGAIYSLGEKVHVTELTSQELGSSETLYGLDFRSVYHFGERGFEQAELRYQDHTLDHECSRKTVEVYQQMVANYGRVDYPLFSTTQHYMSAIFLFSGEARVLLEMSFDDSSNKGDTDNCLIQINIIRGKD